MLTKMSVIFFKCEEKCNHILKKFFLKNRYFRLVAPNPLHDPVTVFFSSTPVVGARESKYCLFCSQGEEGGVGEGEGYTCGSKEALHCLHCREGGWGGGVIPVVGVEKAKNCLPCREGGGGGGGG